RGVAQNNINMSILRQFKVPTPAIEKQIAIVKTLEKVENILIKRKYQLQQLDELVKSRFVEMFGDPVINPYNWATKPFLETGTCKNGMNFHYDDAGVELNCLGVGDFKDFSIIDDTSTLPMVSLNEMPSTEYLLQDGDIVFVRSNGNKALVGRSIAVYPKDIPTTFSGFCIRYRKFYDALTIPYLLRVLKSNSIRKKMMGRGANIQNLNQQILSTIVIPIPPIDLQNEFANFVEQVDKSKFCVTNHLKKIQLIKGELL
ncbi:MAG: restriction endonuclease subunit S, partial [Acutalibacteraceae bacterium]|nr:restriction endonuclease subunit S [Acutalibacteraceae bacterium]